tara:strand:+ start:30663 stop:31301 length:639 start_codon:yes stop_codon:yes gene_type:complete
MKAPKIRMINPGKLIPYDKNPRINDHAVKAVADSIKKHGMNQPVLVDQDFRICVGHTRTLASIENGLKKIPVIVKEMTEAEFIEYNIADNKTGELSNWDEKQLSELMIDLAGLDVNPAEIPGFSDKEMEDLLTFDENDSPGDKKETKKQSKRTSQESTKLVYNVTAKQAMEIDSKLDAIIRENGLDNQVEAILFALKGFKMKSPKVKRVKRS